MNMNIYSNKLKQNLPINTTKEQFMAPSTILIGVTFGRWINKINIQTEITIAAQNITEKINENDTDWVKLKGWSPGIVVNYPFAISKERPYYYTGPPSLVSLNLNLHIGLRYMSFSIPESSGLMVEAGLGFRISNSYVSDYKLKDRLRL